MKCLDKIIKVGYKLRCVCLETKTDLEYYNTGLRPQ